MRLGPRLQRRQALLLEPGDLRLGERLERQFRQRRPAPQRERLVQDDDRSRRLVSRHRAARRRHAALEPLGVELVGAHAEPVARRRRGDRVRVAEHLAQPRHVDPDRLRRAGRRLLAPQRQRQAIGAHRLVGMQEQHREQRARPDAAQRHDTGRVGHLERSEDPEVHRPGRVRYRHRLCAISLAAHLRVPWSWPGTRASSWCAGGCASWRRSLHTRGYRSVAVAHARGPTPGAAAATACVARRQPACNRPGGWSSATGPPQGRGGHDYDRISSLHPPSPPTRSHAGSTADCATAPSPEASRC